LGEATARALVAAGARVAIFDVNADRGANLASEIGAHFVAVDITSDDSVEAGLASARQAQGQERILVNCAGVGSGQKTVSRDRTSGSLRHHSLAEFHKVVEINLVGSFRCIAKSAIGMAGLPTLGHDGERGVIINTASVAAEDGQVGQAAYAASKAGIVGMTLPVARDLMSEGIRVNTILPGIMDTPLLATLPQDIRDSLGASVPFPKRLGRPDEFADMVLSIIRNGYMNGAHVRLDGAIRMAPR
jgi:NAD(P)-dependent dehydrogenase (short-subunit alcohol dehydrogenase family)